MNEKDDLLQFRAKIFKALADPLRLHILQFIGTEEKCVCEIIPELDVVQPLVSRHLGILKKSGLIFDRKEGNKRFYSLTDTRILKIIKDVTPEMCENFSSLIIQLLT